MKLKNNIKIQIPRLRYKPHPQLRERVLCSILQVQKESLHTKSAASQPNIWKIIMKNRLTKPIAAAVFAGILFFGWLNLKSDIANDPNSKTSVSFFFAQACAAEQALFISDQIVYLVNEIIIYPVDRDNTAAKLLLDQLNLSPQQRNYVETVNSWLDYNWLPVCSLQADGQFRYHSLDIATNIDQSYTITDMAWYDPATGHFVREMKTGKTTIFANAFDGDFIRSYEITSDGSYQLFENPVSENFISPQNPAEFLGLTTGFQQSLFSQDFQLTQKTSSTTLEDGTTLRIYKLGFTDLLGEIATYWLFKVRDADDIITEMEFVLTGQTQMIIRRKLSESIDHTPVPWDLPHLETASQTIEENAPLAITPDVYNDDISVEQMIEKAGFETYIFVETPAWTDPPSLSDMVDFANPDQRMFGIICMADDGRHLILFQSQTFNEFFSVLLKQAGSTIFTTDKGYKLWSGGSHAKWWTDIHLRSNDITPVENRSGYVIETPDETFVSLTINGQLTDEELHNLMDNLVPAKEFIQK